MSSGSHSTDCSAVINSCDDVYDSTGNNGEDVCSVDEVYDDRRIWEVEAVGSEPGCDMSVQGRLKEKAGFWRDVLMASQPVLSIIESGYVLPLKSEPTPIVQCITNSQQLLMLTLLSSVC